MRYRQLAPPRALAPFVSRYWVLESDPGDPQRPGPEPVYPNGSAELVFHRRGCFELEDETGSFHREPRALLFGQLQRRITLRPPPRLETVGVSFRAAGLAAFFPVPAAEMTGRAVRLGDVVGSRVSRLLRARVVEAGDAEAALRHVSDFLDRRLCAHRVHPSVAGAASMIAARRGAVRVEELARAGGIGMRQLQRRFRQEVGLSPKRLAAVVRFDRAVGLASRGAGTLSEIAHAAGYYDQPHFIREFRAFTGESPSRWIRRDEEMARFFATS